MISADLQTYRTEFSFSGDVASVALARDTVVNWIQQHGASEAELFDLLVALQEAFANAAIHGCGGDAKKQVNCSVELNSDLLTILIRDPGPGFDVEAVANPAKYQPTRLEHGRGIALMRGLVDEVTFARNGAEVQLKRKITRA